MDMKEKVRIIRERFSERKEKASDMEILLSRFAKLPPGQLKKVLDEESLAIFRKHGIDI